MAFYWYRCGKYLAPIIREHMPFLETHRKPHFHITPAIKEKLLAISPASIDRYLKSDRDALRGGGSGAGAKGTHGDAKQPKVSHPSGAARPCNRGWSHPSGAGRSVPSLLALTHFVRRAIGGWSRHFVSLLAFTHSVR
jgi:hypothetical protein